MSKIIEKTKAALESVGTESPKSNGVWRIALGAFGLVCSILGGIITHDASEVLDTVEGHSKAINAIESSQAVVKSEVDEQGKKLDEATTTTGAIEARTRTLEEHYSSISAKLDTMLQMIIPKRH